MDVGGAALELGHAVVVRGEVEHPLAGQGVRHHREERAGRAQVPAQRVGLQRVAGVVQKRPDVGVVHPGVDHRLEDVEDLGGLGEAEVGLGVEAGRPAGLVPLGDPEVRLRVVGDPGPVDLVEPDLAGGGRVRVAGVEMGDDAVHRVHLGVVELRAQQRVVDRAPVEVAARKGRLRAERHVVARRKAREDRVRVLPLVAVLQARGAEVGAGLHDHVDVRVDPGQRRDVVELRVDGARHGRGEAAVLDGGHLPAAPVLVADLEARDLRRAVLAGRHVAHEAAQRLRVEIGESVAVGVPRLRQPGAGGQDEGDRLPGGLGIGEEVRQRHQVDGRARVVHGRRPVGIGDVEEPLGHRAAGVAQTGHAQRLDRRLDPALLAQHVAIRQEVPPEEGLRDGVAGERGRRKHGHGWAPERVAGGEGVPASRSYAGRPPPGPGSWLEF